MAARVSASRLRWALALAALSIGGTGFLLLIGAQGLPTVLFLGAFAAGVGAFASRRLTAPPRPSPSRVVDPVASVVDPVLPSIGDEEDDEVAEVGRPALRLLRGGLDDAEAGTGDLDRIGPEHGPVRPLAAVFELDEEQAADRLDKAVDGLRQRDPVLSAHVTTIKQQRVALVVAGLLLVLLLVLSPIWAGRTLAMSAVTLYIGAMAFRLQLIFRSFKSDHGVVVTDEEALAVPDHELPVYTVLVPAFGEPGVIGRLLEELSKLDYPAAKLDLRLLLEEGDDDTILAARAEAVGRNVEIVVVPSAHPKTKPKALNYGLQDARGELVTIYDAEDRPDPLQLRKAVVALRRLGPEVACVQAKLAYFNPNQNIITRWFTIEYRMWFDELLPGLSDLDAPVPLGGTSNHFRRSILEELGGWDPYNVTEDADLGVRLHRAGYRTGVLDSITYEEANSDFVNWIRQRSRWYKGYLQTWLVHLRRPRQLYRELGFAGFVRFNFFVGGTPLLSLLNPVFWTLIVLWFLGRPHFLQLIFPSAIYFPAMISWVVGNFLFAYLTVLNAQQSKDDDLAIASLLVPLYWVMMAIAAVKAGIQLIAQPSYWEKTVHGLDDTPRPVATRPEKPDKADKADKTVAARRRRGA